MIFRNWVLQNFPFLEDDFDALTDYELFCKMVEYMKKSLEQITSFQNQLNTFKDELKYFEDYFNNLDLQDEVNNKLDEMAESGELENIISQYIELATTYVYNNVNDMKNATNLVNGSYARTSGFYNINDGGGANYLIRTITNEDTIDNIHLFAITNDDSLVAELIEINKINILQLGAKTTEDATDIINYALENFKEVIIPAGTFNINDSLILKNNTYLHGFNHDSIIKMNKEYTNPLIYANEKNNIKIENITLKNDESHTGSGVPNNLIGNFYECNNININNLYCPVIYSQGIDFKKCGYINILNSKFTNAGHSMLVFLTETHDILVDNCIFDTITGNGTNDYLLATGSKDYETTVEYLCKNLTVQNSKFMNNENWEGLESHGCEDFYAYNNYIYNCYQGIHMYYDDRTPTSTHIRKNVIIKNNTIINTNKTMRYAIIVGGTENYFLNNVIIDSNFIQGGNNTNSDLIYVLYTNYFNITNNNISEIGYQGINTTYVTHGKINDNNLYNFYNAGCVGINNGRNSWLVEIDNNHISCNGNVNYVIAGSANKGISLIGNNICTGYNTAKYYFNTPNKTLIGSNNTTSARRLGCKGIYSRNDDGLIYMHCTDAKIRSVDETTDVKATADVNDKIITSSVSAINSLCPGQEIVIAGAGTAGADLTTCVGEFISLYKFTIDDPIKTAITNADVSTTASTWVADV